ncbi:MAG: hypothetical protein K8T89_09385 [Planctomycetes bacterium]|nr:hypothetical protein [Planctomycetota bacterium]
MKSETDPITEDEWLIRLAWEDKIKNHLVSANLFEPREGRNPDTDGISLYRKDCLADPFEALRAISEDKRDRYGIVLIPVHLIYSLGLTIRIKPDMVPGHVVIPELNIADYKANKVKFTPIKAELAEVARHNIFRRPLSHS